MSPVFRDADGDPAFIAMLPEEWSRDGENDVELYLVSTERGDLAARAIDTR